VPTAGHVAILTYHSLDNGGSVLSTPPHLFAKQMQAVHDSGWRVVDLHTAHQALAAGPQTDNLLALTFDDGFHNFVESGLPVLRHHAFPATMFLVTDYLGKSNDWPGQTASLQVQPLLRWQQVAELASHGTTIGSHTLTHPDLTRLPPATVERELRSSRLALEAVLQHPVDLLAYPYGAHSPAVRRIASRHYRVACSTQLGFGTPLGDAHAVNRLDVYYLRNLELFRNLFSRRVRAYLQARRLLRDIRHALSLRLHFRRLPTDSPPC
jgi:peptidoglycan/xylan/chitin deacetylase (PgdA/CDA1 family)